MYQDKYEYNGLKEVTIIIAIKMLATNWLPLQANFQLRLLSGVLQPFSTAVPSDKPTMCEHGFVSLVPCGWLFVDRLRTDFWQLYSFSNNLQVTICCFILTTNTKRRYGERAQKVMRLSSNRHFEMTVETYLRLACQKLCEVKTKAAPSYEPKKEWKKLRIKEISNGNNMAAFMRLQES